MIAATILDEWNLAPRATLDGALLGALSRARWMPVTAVRAPLDLALVALVEEWALRL